jgi:5'-phosphate synthase pdxT subunit
MQHVGNIPMTFIRAPYITAVGNGVEVLACVDEHIVAARYGNQIGLAFHPEVTDDPSVHRYFLQTVCSL